MKSRIIACLAAVLMMAGVTAAPVSAATLTPYSVSITTSATGASLGNLVKVTGAVQGYGATTAILQQFNGVGWQNWASTRISATKYTVYYKPVSAGHYAIRIYTPATRYHRAGASANKIVDVYKWHYLSDSGFVNARVTSSDSWQSFGDIVDINGRTYLHTPWAEGPSFSTDSYVDYNLSRLCLVFATTAGITDDSESGVTSQLQVSADSVPIFTRTMGLGQTANLSLRVDGVLRLRLADIPVNRSGSGVAAKSAFGDARVLCRFN